MSKRERLHLSRYQSIETYRDWNGRLFIACSSNSSMVFRDAKTLRKWLNLPLKTPSREAFDSWIASLEAADTQRKVAQPLTSEEPIEQSSSILSQELLATGFGPECHDVDNDNTKMIT
jgi:hypothetical protein